MSIFQATELSYQSKEARRQSSTDLQPDATITKTVHNSGLTLAACQLSQFIPQVY
jgi:hypothetical protein